jgi:PAT family beta-lactamase induction signal transducer AmpG
MCLVTLNSPALGTQVAKPKTLKEAVIDPFKDYLKRRGAWQMLLFILIYKLGDNMGLAMNITYVLKLGFTKTQYATFAKTFALAALILGGFIGAAIMEKISMKKSLILFGIFQGVSTGAFALLSYTGVNNAALATLMTFEHLSYGMGGAAFSTFILSLTNRKYSGTQYALLTSLTGVPRVIFSAYTGVLATEMGWVGFYVLCGVVAIPGLLLLTQFDKWQKESV